MREAARLHGRPQLHYYTLPTGTWDKKGSATEFDESEWFVTLTTALRMDELIRATAPIMDQYDPEKRVGLIVDEWGTWYDVEPGTNPGFLYQQNTLRDALVAAINLNIFNQHADRVQMANIAQTVNVLQAMILTDGREDGADADLPRLRDVQGHQDATLLPLWLSCDDYTLTARHPRRQRIGLRGCARRDHALPVQPGSQPLDRTQRGGARDRDPEITGRVLTAGAIDAHNTLKTPTRRANTI